MVDKTVPKDIKKMSFEDALHELEKIVGGLEQGAGKLDEAISAYERGTLLRQHCEAKLREARERVETINVSTDGSVSAEPAEIE
ncbi:MAG: exodeoxyribonuclease VII small subunit [Rhodospirillaceae bacterium]|nr:exodeoxyribonuclease VII small subunit [Rhodospirillaceae bacterium]